MDLKDSIKEAMYDLPDTEKLIVLSVMIDTLMDSMEDMKKEIRFIRSIPVSKIDVFPDHPFYVDDDEDKVDIRDWSEKHDRMTRGITFTEEQAMKLTRALVDRYRSRAIQEHAAPVKDDMAR